MWAKKGYRKVSVIFHFYMTGKVFMNALMFRYKVFIEAARQVIFKGVCSPAFSRPPRLYILLQP